MFHAVILRTCLAECLEDRNQSQPACLWWFSLWTLEYLLAPPLTVIVCHPFSKSEYWSFVVSLQLYDQIKGACMKIWKGKWVTSIMSSSMLAWEPSPSCNSCKQQSESCQSYTCLQPVPISPPQSIRGAVRHFFYQQIEVCPVNLFHSIFKHINLIAGDDSRTTDRMRGQLQLLGGETVKETRRGYCYSLPTFIACYWYHVTWLHVCEIDFIKCCPWQSGWIKYNEIYWD